MKRRTYKRDARGRFAGGGSSKRAGKRKARARAYVKSANAFTAMERRNAAASRRAPGTTRTAKPVGRIGRAMQALQGRKDRKMEKRSGMKIRR